MSPARRIGILVASLLLCGASGGVTYAGPGPGPGPDPDAPAVGEAPAFDVERYHGRVVLLDFWASWCGPCRESFPWMAEMAQRHGADGLVVVAVNLDEERSAAESFLGAFEWPFEIVFDPGGHLARSFDLQGMPTTLLWDREGRLVERREGFHAADADAHERALVAALEGRLEPLAAALPAPTDARDRGVRPWQRERLARQEMRLDADPLDLEIDDHIYFSKEASSGGRSFGGGGCGCN
jgi:thiol-disulfide isomerase/thioredoxin